MGRNDDISFVIKQQNEEWSNKMLDKKSFHPIVKILNMTLADEAVLCMKTCLARSGTHGQDSYQRRRLLDVQYERLIDISDRISERVLMLGDLPIVLLDEFLSHTRLNKEVEDDTHLIDLAADHEAISRFLWEDSKKCSALYQDEETCQFLFDMIYLHKDMAELLRYDLEKKHIYAESQ